MSSSLGYCQFFNETPAHGLLSWYFVDVVNIHSLYNSLSLIISVNFNHQKVFRTKLKFPSERRILPKVAVSVFSLPCRFQTCYPHKHRSQFIPFPLFPNSLFLYNFPADTEMKQDREVKTQKSHEHIFFQDLHNCAVKDGPRMEEIGRRSEISHIPKVQWAL